MKTFALAFAALSLCCSLSCLAEETARAPRSRILVMLETRFVEGRELNGPPEEYAPDNDPNTIELVALRRKDDRPSHLTDDGQVVFLTAKDLRNLAKMIEPFLERAIDIRMQQEAQASAKQWQ